MPELIQLGILLLLGVAAGFLNITAGGGSLLTLPFLIFMGLPATVANGTNRIAILAQNMLATARFHRFQVIPRASVWVAVVPAVLGALVGAQIAVQIDEVLFKRILAAVLIGALGLMLFGPGRHAPEVPPQLTWRKKILMGLAFAGLGVYGGFIQAGIGLLIILVLTAIGYDLVRTNALKVLVVLIFTPLALVVFMVNGQVDYLKGLVLASGNALGAWLGAHVVVQKGHWFLRWIVMAAVVGFALKLLLE